MIWNWQQKNWPQFSWKKNMLEALEEKFLHQSGILTGGIKHCSQEDKTELLVSVMTGEAIKTSEIEGEYLNRDSVQSSIRRNFGLDNNNFIAPAERNIADLLTDLYQNFDQPLSHLILYKWHQLLMRNRNYLKDIGCYRTHKEPMRVISGHAHKIKVHFEAPPSNTMRKEMDQFIKWFNATAPGKELQLPALTRAGITHLYFVCIHPFEDGNGRLARALAEKALSQCLGEPTLIALSQIIYKHRKLYYQALELNNKENEITDWLVYFGKTVLEAQNYSIGMIDFLIEKTKLYDKIRDQLNSRQEKVIQRLFQEDIEGFKGGLSAENYLSITGTSRATATRDLQDLVEKNVLMKTGELKSTRYYLNIKNPDISS